MLMFYLRLALKSMTRTPGVTLIAVLGIGIGVGVSTSMTSLHHLFTQDPIPHKSGALFNVRTDSWDPDQDFFGVAPGDPPKAQSYRDMMGLMANQITQRETGVGNASGYVFPEDDQARPYTSVMRLCHADFFGMFEVPFLYGGPWQSSVDGTFQPVVVLSKKANQKLFAGVDSVGKTVKLGNHAYTVVGVLDRFQPTPLYYDCVNSLGGTVRDFFLPFDAIRQEDSGLSIWGNTDGWGPSSSYQGDNLFTVADFYWIQHWVELEPGSVAAYRDFVDQYAKNQKALGRFPRPLNNQVTPMLEWVEDRNFQLGVTRAIMIISILFLMVCAINLSGLLLGKFLARSTVIGIHRALGASRRSVFWRHLIECEVIGLAGGLMGLAVAYGALRLVARSMQFGSAWLNPGMFTIDGFGALMALVFALLAGLIAGIYPAWRAGRIAPAVQIKV